MNTIRISATAARNKFFTLLDQVAQGTEVIIEKDRKEVAVMTPKVTKTDWVALRKASKAVHGIWKDVELSDLPTRKKGAWARLGKWDKELLSIKKA